MHLQVHLCLTNQMDRTLGPFEVYLAPSISGEEKAVLVNGLQKLVRRPISYNHYRAHVHHYENCEID